MSQAGIINVASQTGVVDSVTGTNGVTASPTTGNVVVSGVNATTSTVGVASFNPANFTVNGSGQVSPISNIQSTQVTVTSAQIKTMRASPILLIPAGGVNTIINMLGVALKFVYGGTNPFTNGQNLNISYVNASGTTVASTVFASGTINGTANAFSINPGTGASNQAAGKIDNQSIFLCNAGLSEITGNAAGDNQIIVYSTYVVSIV